MAQLVLAIHGQTRTLSLGWIFQWSPDGSVKYGIVLVHYAIMDCRQPNQPSIHPSIHPSLHTLLSQKPFHNSPANERIVTDSGRCPGQQLVCEVNYRLSGFDRASGDRIYLSTTGLGKSAIYVESGRCRKLRFKFNHGLDAERELPLQQSL